MQANLKHHLALQLIVIIAGFTGILGDLISVPAEQVTFFRTLIAFISLVPLSYLVFKAPSLSWRDILILLGIGIIVGLHWFTFFYSIKCSTVSIAVICLATTTLFMSLIEPIIFKRKVSLSEVLLGLCIIVGMIIIYGFESDQIEGIIYGVVSAFLATIFTALNAKNVRRIKPVSITQIEMAGACLTMFLILVFQGGVNSTLLDVSWSDWIYLLVLGIVCTSFAFIMSVWVMNYISPFTVSISYNLEPIYTMLLALLIGWFSGTTKEHMTGGFYLGSGIILLAVFTNAWMKKRQKSVRKIGE